MNVSSLGCRRVFEAARCALLAALLLWTAVPALAQGNAPIDRGAKGRNFDARVEENRDLDHRPSGRHEAALRQIGRDAPGLMKQIDRTTGVTRSLFHPTRVLADGPAAGLGPRDNARAFIEREIDTLGLDREDLDGMEVTDEVLSPITGVSHVYFRQTLDGLPVYNGQLHVNLNGQGQIQSVNNAFLPNLKRSVNSLKAARGAEQAVASTAEHLGIDLPAAPKVLSVGSDPQQTTLLDGTGLSFETIEAKLMLLAINRGNARLVWNFQIQTLDSQHWYDINVDAVSGKVWTRFDWTNGTTYRVYPQPVESPQHTSPLPPNDARVLVSNPENALASPDGWFSGTGTILDGNNVHACVDANANNSCDSNVSCPGQNCDFSINLSSAPSNSQSAAVTNLFYWNNIIHDIQYQHGFTEVAGNFQENNFGRGGAGSDSVNADAQDGSGNCNANFGTPGDGGNPRMQMFLCNNASPSRDGDYDAGVIVHEYGHGISVRQVGGPGNSGCLNNAQQGGEGWSDWHALVYTAKASDTGPQARGVGSYLFALAPDGTIRPQRYSTSSAINNYTYQSISGQAIPHGVGSVWAQAIWEVYWALVDKHGFDSNLYNPGSAPGAAGNTRALTYINEGLKFTACSPTFIEARNGIIDAAETLHGGEDVCDIWGAFAAFGLGTNASTPGSNSTSATNGFNIPVECQCSPQAVADAGPDQITCLGDAATVGTPALPGHSYSWSPGGETTAQIAVSPSVTTTYTVIASTVCGTDTDSATVTVDDGSSQTGLDDDFEGDNSDWSATGLWHAAVNSSCASPEAGFNSPVTAFYYGQDGSCDYDTGAANSGSLTSPPIGGITSTSTLTFQYLRQVESFNGDFDRTRVEIVTGSGATTMFSLNATNPSTVDWVSSPTISLASFAGETIEVRFVLETGDNVDNDQIGWFIDDVVVTGDSQCAPTGNTPPTVTITAPPDGTTVTLGTPINFTGTASDAEDGDLTAAISWSSSIDGTLGTGGSINATLSTGTHTITASVTDSGGLSDNDSISVTVEPDDPPPTGNPPIDWNNTANVSYADQDVSGNVTVEDSGATMFLQANTWRRTTEQFTIGPDTVLEFDFSSTDQGEIHGAGFDENDVLNDSPRLFMIYGNQNWTGAGHISSYTLSYSGSGAFEPFAIHAGSFIPAGDKFLVLINDNDAGAGNSRYRNVRVRDCFQIDDFSGGSEGWTNDPASTCSTGSFVTAVPTAVNDGGVLTQLAGDHSSGGGNAFFTATNSAAGTNDVDGGTCIANSPVYTAPSDAEVQIWYFHGQRDAGGDPADGFRLEASVNGGPFTTLASFGDETVDAAWQKASVTLSAGQSVQFRVEVTDGTATGDLVEAGIDDIFVCPN